MAQARKSRIEVLLEQIGSLPAEERAELQRRIGDISSETAPAKDASARKTHDIMELEGLGKEFWDSIDVEEYLKQERASWGS